jgi:hypothetical protein
VGVGWGVVCERMWLGEILLRERIWPGKNTPGLKDVVTSGALDNDDDFQRLNIQNLTALTKTAGEVERG